MRDDESSREHEEILRQLRAYSAMRIVEMTFALAIGVMIGIALAVGGAL